MPTADRVEAPEVSARGRVIWITGLSGAGKTTLARRVVQRLLEQGTAAVFLDGDDLRLVVADPSIGHDRVSRLTHAMRICRFAKLLADQNHTVVVSTMSLFREVHSWNRENLGGYFEVFIDVSMAALRARDARGLYSRAERSEVVHVVGVHDSYDKPQNPHLTLKNEDASRSIDLLACTLLENLPNLSRSNE